MYLNVKCIIASISSATSCFYSFKTTNGAAMKSLLLYIIFEVSSSLVRCRGCFKSQTPIGLWVAESMAHSVWLREWTDTGRLNRMRFLGILRASAVFVYQLSCESLQTKTSGLLTFNKA